MTGSQRAVVYDSDDERAAQVAGMLRQLQYQPMVIDHAALVRTVLQSTAGGQVLLIGDVTDAPDWEELGAALNGPLGDLPVVVYGSQSVIQALTAAAGAARMTQLSYPFTAAALSAAMQTPLSPAPKEAGPASMPTGSSSPIRAINRLIRQVAVHGSSVLILGESGTGKELAARAIHDASPRRQRPFVAINCGAIPAELLESELFGHEKGAFTGAVATRKGRFEIAEGGTLFLDEIGDMSMTMQVKLLRVLQERVFERVGSHAPIRCNVRIIAATHRNLEDSIAKGTFREDLFYRLNVFPIEMPPLRARLEDMPLLVRDFAETNFASGRSRVQVTPSALEALKAYSWPGNVRELANLIERMSILCADKPVQVGDLPTRYRPPGWSPVAEELNATFIEEEAAAAADDRPETPTPRDLQLGLMPDEQALLMLAPRDPHAELAKLPVEGLDLRAHLYEIERALIRQALDRAGGTVAHAARLLQLRRTTLVEKLRKFELVTDQIASEL